MSGNSALTQFGSDDPPKIDCEKWIQHPTRPDKEVGTVGTDTSRGIDCALFIHRREDHRDGGKKRPKTYNEEYEGYAISDWILRFLRAEGVNKIFISVTDEETVYEFSRTQYVEGKGFEWRDGDPQHVVPTTDAQTEWDANNVTISDPEDSRWVQVDEKHLAGRGL